MAKIKDVKAREILCSNSSPTVEVEVMLEDDSVGVSSAPFGSSAGVHEAAVLLDGNKKRYNGNGALKAVANVNGAIASKIRGMEALEQEAVDQAMIDLDGTDNKSRLGGNAIIATSVAVARAAAASEDMPLYKYIRKAFNLKYDDYKLPNPMMVVIEGGEHADNSTDMQEYLICAIGGESLKENVRMGIETYQALKGILEEKDYNTNVGSEGAYAPPGIQKNDEPLELIMKGIEAAGFAPGKDVAIALDPAVSEIYKDGKYVLAKEDRSLSAAEMINYWVDLKKRYPALISLEDGLAEDDWENWPKLKQALGDQMMIMGDDFTVTNPKRLQRAIDENCINSILIKRNQVGSLTETIKTITLAGEHGYKHIMSHRGGGETNDVALIDIGVATNAAFVKVGPSRGERMVKYNYLMQVEDYLKKKG